MKRLAVLTVLLLVGAVSLVAARQQSQPPATLEIQKVKENLYMITGGGGNSAVFVTQQGVVLVDTKIKGNGPGLLEKIKSVTDKPVTMVINTHTHFDHVGSNEAFTGPVEFVAHENCKTGMENMPGLFRTEVTKKFLPGKTYRDKLSLLKGDDQVDLYYYGRGHTDGDSLVVFPALKVMHSGDLFPAKQTPIMDTNNGGSGVEYPRTLAKAVAGIRGVETVIPGHSSVTDWNTFKEFSEFMNYLVVAVQQAKKDGKTEEQAAAEIKLPEKYQAYSLGRLKTNIATIYSETK